MNKYWKYILVLSLLMTACDMPFMPEISNVPGDVDVESRTDAEGRDARNYSDTLYIVGPEKDAAFWMSDQDVSVTTNFPAPSWFR